MTKKLTLLPVLGAAGVAALAAAGCGNSADAGASQNPATSTPSTTAAPAPSSSSATPAAGHTVKVTIDEWAVKADTSRVAAGRTTFDVTNAGKVPHEMVLLRTTKPAGSLGSGSRIAETGHVGEVGDLKPGASGKVVLKLKPGHYSIVCNLPGHYMAGMHTDLTVG